MFDCYGPEVVIVLTCATPYTVFPLDGRVSDALRDLDTRNVDRAMRSWDAAKPDPAIARIEGVHYGVVRNSSQSPEDHLFFCLEKKVRTFMVANQLKIDGPFKTLVTLSEIDTRSMLTCYCLDAPDNIPAGSYVSTSTRDFECIVKPSAISR
jgi:hypothetical protein